MHLNVTPIMNSVKRLKMKFKSKTVHVILDTLHCESYEKLVSLDANNFKNF